MSPSTPNYGIVVDENVMVPMRDGVRLATDIYRPAIDGQAVPGPLPTILGRTSYDKRWRWLWIEPVARYFAPRGYVVAVQDLRGRRRSEGVGQYFHTANVHEGEDGYDTVEWIAAQPWSNGRVGMTGSSHGGLVQTVASLTRPPHLTAIWVDVSPINIFAHEAREGGAMSLWMFSALFLHAHDAPEIADDPEARETILDGWRRMRELVQSMPFKPGETPAEGRPEPRKDALRLLLPGRVRRVLVDGGMQPGAAPPQGRRHPRRLLRRLVRPLRRGDDRPLRGNGRKERRARSGWTWAPGTTRAGEPAIPGRATSTSARTPPTASRGTAPSACAGSTAG